MTLSTEDKDELIRLLRNGQSIPLKYRSKLFPSLMECELHWNGKSAPVSDGTETPVFVEQYSYQNINFETSFVESPLENTVLPGRSWTNLLFYGDNLSALNLLSTSESTQQNKGSTNGIRLIYIDPPFFTDSDFYLSNKSKKSDSINRKMNLAYSDSWTQGFSQYMSMLYQRLKLMHSLLSSDGSLYVHCDWRANAHIRLILDEIFGRNCFQREIIWRIGWVSGFKTKTRNWIRNHDTILFYTKDPQNYVFNKAMLPHPAGYERRNSGQRKQSIGRPIEDTWNTTREDSLDSIQIKSFSQEKTGYPTQKNEALIRRIIQASSNEGDLIADFFCGSGTTLVVSNDLNRRWIGCDQSPVSISISRNRLLDTCFQKHQPALTSPFNIVHLKKSSIPPHVGETATIGQPAGTSVTRAVVKQFGASLVEDTNFHGHRKGWPVFVAEKSAQIQSELIMDLQRKAMSDWNGRLIIVAPGYSLRLLRSVQEISQKSYSRTALVQYEVIHAAFLDQDDRYQFHFASLASLSKKKLGDGMIVTLNDYTVFSGDTVPGNDFRSLIDHWAVGFLGKTTMPEDCKIWNNVERFIPSWWASRKHPGMVNLPVQSAQVTDQSRPDVAMAVHIIDCYGSSSCWDLDSCASDV